MGITGLLPFLKNIQKEVHVSSLKGMKVGVDAYCWLHKGAFSCSTQIVMKTAKVETLPIMKYCVRRVNILRQHDITPIIVFDGGYLPTKANTEKNRRERRQSYLSKGKELLKLGKRSEARECFQKCVDISPEIALAFIKECRKLGVECIVAPYEADAQLAYLSMEGIIDVVISEDSDLLVFGSRKVLFKMDESGNGKLIELKDLGKANKCLVGFSQKSFRQMCILSGCDYLPSVHGIGLVKASRLMRRHNHNPTQVIRSLRCDGSNVPSDYDLNFMKAEHTFLHQIVYDPRSRQQVRLCPLPNDVDPGGFKFAGIEQSPRKAVLMARGNINPITLEVFDHYSPSKDPPPSKPASSLSKSWSCSAMGSANKHYPVDTQSKLSITSSTQSSCPFKPPSFSSTLSSSGIPTRGSGANEALGDDELQSLYSTSSPLGSGCDNELQSGPTSKASTTEPHLMLSRFFSHNLSSDTTTPTSVRQLDDVDDSIGHLSPSRSPTPSADSSFVSIAQSCGRNPSKKRLFIPSNSKLNRFSFSEKHRRLEEHDDSGIEINGSWNGTMLRPHSSHHIPSGSPPRLTDDKAGQEISNTERLLSNNAVTATTKVRMCSSDRSNLVTEISPRLMDDKSGLETSLGKQTLLTEDLLSVKNTDTARRNIEITSLKSHGRRKTAPCTKFTRVGLSKKMKPPRLSGSGPKQLQLKAFNFTKRPQLKLQNQLL